MTLKGEMLKNVKLARYTTWRVGGIVPFLYRPYDIDDLQTFLKDVPPEENITWLGLGSNVLVRDAGVPGIVILTQGRLKGFEQLPENHIRVEAGMPCPIVAKRCAESGLAGAEFFTGIPGTVGGALAMNAGAFGTETWSLVESVETINHTGERLVRPASDFEIGYRQVALKDDAILGQDEWFVSANLRLSLGESAAIKADIKQLLEKRNTTQPIGEPSCGSVFQNPPGDYAARLIEACGLKGKMLGGAMVSPKHANFIVNYNNATAADIEHLIEHVQATVYEQHTIWLRPEVRIIGQGAEA